MPVIVILLVILTFVYWYWHLKLLFKGKHSRLFALLIIAFFLVSLIPRANVLFFWLSSIQIIWFTLYLQISLVSDVGLAVYLRIKKIKLTVPNSRHFYRVIFLLSCMVTVLFFSLGAWNNYYYRFHTVEIPIAGLHEKIRGVYFSDIHLAAGFPKSKMQRLVSDIDSIAPDVVFFGGDLADASNSYLDQNGFDDLFRKIKAPLGFYGVIGNHEGYLLRSGSDFVAWMNKNGMVTLLDSTVCNRLFCVSGRLDNQYASHLDLARKPLDYLSVDVLKQKRKKMPWIVLDHQPKGFEGEKPKITPDLVISGHTHAGQFFPGNIIIDWIWDLSAGLGYLDGALWFVSSGVHSWGPPVRILTNSELVIFDFVPKKE
jgi:predicted MPP superfamily phosphohydrolase